MVAGMDRFRAYFKDYQASYILIGGVAASISMELLGEPFRTTKDLDVVLVVEALDQAFVRQFWRFIKDGGYTIRQNGGRLECLLFSTVFSSLKTKPSPRRSSFFAVSLMGYCTTKLRV